jgi:Lipid A 3-O-deacylase (PagL)
MRSPLGALLAVAWALGAPGGSALAQDGRAGDRVGLEGSLGTQQLAPFDDRDYLYRTRGYKLLVNHPFLRRGAVSYEWQLEPSVYLASHRLLNQYYVKPSSGPDYLARRAAYTRDQAITEFALNLGALVRLHPSERWSLFVMASTGPMYSDTRTERMARGLAFSDVVACGVGYQVGEVMLELRPGLRHVSNGNLQLPNAGYNSVNVDLSVSVFR